MIEHLNLLECSDENLAYWMCIFIYSACCIIPREIPERQRSKEYDEGDELYYYSPVLEDIDTLEDLYYLTLYVLHNLYSRDGDC